MTLLPPLPDRELLAAFVKKADGKAFDKLTERYLGMVFGVALRRTGCRETAQEAAQNTFCRLARQASSLRNGNSLAAWLHTVALREAGTLMRAEAVRQRALRRMQETIGASPPLHTPISSNPPGSEHLDEALAALPEAARRVLVLRYLQGMSLREISLEENTSEEAVRKRVTRALERLTRSFARRGVTAAGVTACLATANVLWPSPSSAATLAARAIKQASAPAAGAGLSGMAGFALSQWPVAAVFLLTAIPAAWPWGGEGSSRVKKSEAAIYRSSGQLVGRSQDNQRAEMSVSQVKAEVATMRQLSGFAAMQNKTARTPVTPAEIAAAMLREMSAFPAMDLGVHEPKVPVWHGTTSLKFKDLGTGALRLAAARRAVLDFSLEEVREAVRLCKDNITMDAIGPALYARWAELDPEEARLGALASKSRPAIEGVLQALAATDLPGAARWAVDHSPDQLQELLEPLAAADPIGYFTLMDSMAGAPGIGSKHDQFDNIFRYHPKLALEGWRELELQGNLEFSDGPMRNKANLEEVDPPILETLLSFADSLPDDSTLRAECRRVAAQVLVRDDPERAAGLQVAAGTLGATAFDWNGEMESLLNDWKQRDAAGAAQWLVRRSGLDPDEQRRLARAVGVELPVSATPHSLTTP